MITIIRQNQRWLLLIVAIMTIIAFAWLYNTTDTEQLGANRVAQMYGRTVYQVDVDRAVRIQQLAAILGMNEFLRDLSLTARDEDGVLEEFVWNLLVLRHQAGELWIEPTEAQVADAIRNLPALQQNGQFDPSRYLALLQEQLAPRGLTERHLEELIRDSLALAKIRRLVTSPVALSPAEAAESMRTFQPVDVTVFQVPPFEGETPSVTSAEVEEFFTQNESGLMTPAFRRVVLAEIGLTPEEAELEGRARIEALQKAADRISQMYDAVAEGTDFAAAAEAVGATVTTTAPFSAQGFEPGENPALPGPSAGLPPNLVAQVFRLQSAQPVSEIVQDGARFLVARLDGEIEPRPLTLAEVRPQVEEFLAAQKAQTVEQQRAMGFRNSIAQALAAGTPAAEAARTHEVSSLELTGLEPWVQGMTENSFYARLAATLDEGELSTLEQGPTGFFFVHLTRRHAADAELATTDAAQAKEGFLSSKKSLLFLEWLRHSRAESDLRFFQQRS
jgi:hypothetical protein